MNYKVRLFSNTLITDSGMLGKVEIKNCSEEGVIEVVRTNLRKCRKIIIGVV